MGRVNRDDQLRRKSVKESTYPEVYVDPDADFAAVKLAPGIEARSYVKDGVLFSEDKRGRVIEIQFLNLSGVGKAGRRKRPASGA